jgi:hypothetical protein
MLYNPGDTVNFTLLRRDAFGWLLCLLMLHVIPTEMVWCYGPDGSVSLERSLNGSCIDCLGCDSLVVDAPELDSGSGNPSLQCAEAASDCVDIPASLSECVISVRGEQGPQLTELACPAAVPTEALTAKPVLRGFVPTIRPPRDAVRPAVTLLSTVLRI